MLGKWQKALKAFGNLLHWPTLMGPFRQRTVMTVLSIFDPQYRSCFYGLYTLSERALA